MSNLSLEQFYEFGRQFRRIETTRLLDQDPTPTDLLYHKTILHALLALGNLLVLDGEHTENMLAYIRELEHSYIEWHGELSDETRAELNRRIFGAAP